MKKHRYRVWRVIVRKGDIHLIIRCRHDTDNLDEVRASYRAVFTNKVKVSLCYTEFDDAKKEIARTELAFVLEHLKGYTAEEQLFILEFMSSELSWKTLELSGRTG